MESRVFCLLQSSKHFLFHFRSKMCRLFEPLATLPVPLPDPLSATPDIFFGTAERDNLLGKISDQQNQIDALQKKIDAHAGEHEQLQNSVRQQQLSVADSKKKINEQQVEIGELRASVNQQSQQLEEKDKEIAHMKNACHLLNEIIMKKEDEIFDLRLRVHDLLPRKDDKDRDERNRDPDHTTSKDNENNDDNDDPKEGGSKDYEDDPNSSNDNEDDDTTNGKVDVARFENFTEDSCSNYLQDQVLPFLEHAEKLSEISKDKIGEGKFGKVFPAMFEGESVVVKTVSDMSLMDLCVEMELCLKLRHQNIPRAKFSFLTQNELGEAQVNLVFPLMDKLDVRHEFDSRNRNFSHSQTNKICFEVSKALEYLHGLNIVHRDIKPDNILLSSSNNIQLCDFGLCRDFSKRIKNIRDSSQKTKTILPVGTLPYMAPEMCSLGSKHGAEVDIWAMGVMFCELVSAIDYAPYSFNKKTSVDEQLKGIRAFVYPKGFLKITALSKSYELTAKQDFIVRQCLSKKVQNRPSAAKMLKLFQDLPHELLF